MDKSKQLWRKRARLHFFSEKKGETGGDRTACVVSLFKYVFCFPTEPNFDPSLCPQSDDCICQAQTRGDAMHTHKHISKHNHKLCWTALCTHAPASLKTHTHKHTLKCSKEIRAAGQGGVRLASSANLLFLHLSRSPGIITHILDIALQFLPWMGKRKGCLLLYAVGMCKWTPARSNCGTLWPEGEFSYWQMAV